MSSREYGLKIYSFQFFPLSLSHTHTYSLPPFIRVLVLLSLFWRFVFFLFLLKLFPTSRGNVCFSSLSLSLSPELCLSTRICLSLSKSEFLIFLQRSKVFLKAL